MGFIAKIFFICMLANSVLGADQVSKFSLQDALNSKFAKNGFDKDITFKFGSGYAGETFSGDKFKKTTSRSFSSDEMQSYDVLTGEVKTISKDNEKSSLEKSCQYALIACLKVAQKRAKSLGYTKIVNIKTYFKDEVLDSKSEFICGHRKVKNVGISYDYAK